MISDTDYALAKLEAQIYRTRGNTMRLLLEFAMRRDHSSENKNFKDTCLSEISQIDRAFTQIARQIQDLTEE